MINELIKKSFAKLNEHPINKDRIKKGLMPANIFLTRDGGTDLPKIKQLNNWAAVQYMPLEIGICKAAGMQVFSFPYPSMKNFDVYENLHAALERAIEFSIKIIKSKNKFDYLYIHFKETDVPGHDDKPNEKKAMIELLDKKFFSFLRDFAEKNKVQVAVTGDHSTPCSLRSHSSDPVPLLLFGENKGNKKKFDKDECKRFNENEAKKGKLGKIYGKEFLKKIGFV